MRIFNLSPDNRNAFRGGEANGSELRRIFQRAGNDVAYVDTQENDWECVLSPEIERAIIVGGDGTVEQAAPHLKGVPFSILPFGTANNIARCLHQTSNPELLASQLETSEVRQLDLGKVTYGAESNPFLECSGLGVFVELLFAMQEWPKTEEMEQAESRIEKFAHALEQIQAISRTYKGMALELKADGAVICDRLMMLEVMNMKLIGPRLNLAPDADPSDGSLDLVLVREGNRNHFCRWLECQSPGQNTAARFESRRCHRIEVNASIVAPLHIDSRLIEEPAFPLRIEIEPAALKYAVVKAVAHDT
jgi:diacylglycerol kinase family enzyme